MNILYISRLRGGPWAGPTYSVPKQIEAQAIIDNVFWYNLYGSINENWHAAEWEKLPYYHNLVEYPEEKLQSLPKPFNKPDLVVFEQFNNYIYHKIARSVIRSKIPYVIIPRGELTESAQTQSRLKKYIANLVFLKKFSHKASAIQFLTQKEQEESTRKWNEKYIIIPNGTIIPEENKKIQNHEYVNCIYIGRIDIYHKGLDDLINACGNIREELLKKKCTIKIYGAGESEAVQEVKRLIEINGLVDIISLHDGVYQDAKKRILELADVFIITSRFEGHPTALLEALAYSLPCVVTTGTNMRHEVEEYDAGWTADNNVSSITEALNRMLLEQERLPQKGINAKQLALQYDWNKLAQKTHHAYQKLITTQ